MALFDDDSFSSVSLDEPETGLHCQPCVRDGETVDATWFCIDCDDYLCDGCWKAHRKLKTLQKHVLLDKAEAKTRPKTGQAAAANPPSDYAAPVKMCSTHSGQPNEYYCSDCSQFCCSICATTSHKQCETVFLPDISKYLSPPMDLEQLKREVDIIAKGVKTVRGKMEAKIDEIETKHSKVAESLTDLIEDVTALLTDLVGEVGHTAQNINEQNISCCERIIRRAEEAERKIRDAEAEVASKGTDGGVLFEQMIIVNDTLRAITEVEKGEEKISHKDALASMTQVFNFVTLLHKFFYDMELKPIPDCDLADFSLQTEDDTEEPVITGALVTSTRLIIADRGNQKVKVFDTEKRGLITELKLSVLFASMVARDQDVF